MSIHVVHRVYGCVKFKLPPPAFANTQLSTFSSRPSISRLRMGIRIIRITGFVCNLIYEIQYLPSDTMHGISATRSFY